MSLQVGQKCHIGSKTGPFDSRWKNAVFVIEHITTGVKVCQTGVMVNVVTEDERVPIPSRYMTLDSAWIQPITGEGSLFDDPTEPS